MGRTFRISASLLLSILIAQLAVAAPGWQAQESGTQEDLHSVDFLFLDPQWGTCVGSGSTVLHTENAGETWTAQTLPISADLLALSFGYEDFGITTGHSGAILRTYDGGGSWETLQDGWIISYHAVQNLGASYGWAVGVNTIFQPLVAYTTDGWDTFDHVSFYLQHGGQNHEGTLYDAIFNTADIGFAAAGVWNGEGAIVGTWDGGHTWETVHWSPYALYGIDFPVSDASLIGYAVGDLGTILKTTDGGYNWFVLQSGFYVTLTDVSFTDFDTGTAVGLNGVIMRTTDGGQNWSFQYAEEPGDYNSVCMVDTYNGYIVGDGGTILHTTTGGEPTAACSVDMIPDNPPVIVHPGDFFTYTGILSNNTNSPQTTDVWLMVDVPEYGLYGPVKRFLNVPLQPNESITVPNIRQYVPHFAPPGEYGYIAYCGDFPDGAEDSASFDFEVVLPAEGSADNWNLCGWFDNFSEEIPQQSALLNSYPNPFNAATEIKYILAQESHVKLDVFNLAGQVVETLVDDTKPAGEYSVNWDASDKPSGIYLYKLTTKDYSVTKRMTFLK